MPLVFYLKSHPKEARLKSAIISFLLGIGFIGVTVSAFWTFMRFTPIWLEWAKYSSGNLNFLQIVLISFAISLVIITFVFAIYIFLFTLHDIYAELNLFWLLIGTTTGILTIFALIIPDSVIAYW